MIADKLRELLGREKVRTGEPLREHLSFRVGGPCRCMVFPETEKEILSSAAYCREEGIPWILLGKGTNVIALDDGFDGAVIQLAREFNEITADENDPMIQEGLQAVKKDEQKNEQKDEQESVQESGQEGAQKDKLRRERQEEKHIYAQSGASLAAVARAAKEHALSGFSFASGIPGSLGGGVFMNAGAYGGEMADCVRAVRVLTMEGEIRWVPGEDCEFGYRSSIFQKNGAIILGAVLGLQPGNEEEIQREMEELTRRRNEKQPVAYPSAGSTFRRPAGHFAGKLIEDAGLKGCRVGGAMVSDMHAGFLINYENASSQDVLGLIALVQERVFAGSGVWLEPEVRILGEKGFEQGKRNSST